MALQVNIKNPQSKAEEIKRTKASVKRGLHRWLCKCEGGTKINKGSLVNCPDCWTRRDRDGILIDADGERVDG